VELRLAGRVNLACLRGVPGLRWRRHHEHFCTDFHYAPPLFCNSAHSSVWTTEQRIGVHHTTT
jgi:hypothetical protein